MDKRKFGAYIKEARLNKNYTQQELANLLFIDVSAVSKWERGVSYPDITLIPDICRILDVNEHELIVSGRDDNYRKMKKDANKYNALKKGVVLSLNASYVIAILVCFIVNIAVSHTLSWFFIVLTSILCAYSFCPTITWLFTKRKTLAFLVSTFASLSLLFFTCSMYTGNYWFMIAIMSILLGYFIIVYPCLYKRSKQYVEEETYIKISKWFLFSYILGMFLLTNLLLIVIYFYSAFKLKLGLRSVGGIFVIPMTFGIINLFEIGKSFNKPLLWTLAGVFILFICFCLGRSIYLKSTESKKIYRIEDIYNIINIEGKSFDINIYSTTNNENKVEYIENKQVNIVSKVVDGVLMISEQDNRKFYDRLFGWNHLEVNLYLSQETIDALNIVGTTTDIEINQGFTFSNVNITNSSGDVEFKSNVSGNLNIKNSTGDIDIENTTLGNTELQTNTGDISLDNVNCNKLDVKVSTGETELNRVLVTGDFTMEGSTGDLLFEDFDANNIHVTLSTGDVKGTLLSSKIFNVRSETGSVSVPETYSGGICKITLRTGSVKIRYK